MKKQVAIYLRLSQEDLNKGTNTIKDNSNSIISQRLLINRYLDQTPDLCGLPRLEFCDDGFSGINFKRPNFERMIDCVKDGEISCIVVKDLSRFGRDYLEVGDYLEHVFPFLGIRFLSVNDHYDSIKHKGRTIGMDVAFRNLIYDYYSKDLSKKIKTAMSVKQKEARYVSCTPYGYKVLPDNKHQLVIDEQTALIVRRIFTEVVAGKSCTQIAKELNSEGVPTPAQAKSIKTTKQPQWTHFALLTIIDNIKYTGTMVNHTRESRFVRDKNQRHVPKEEWYIRHNAHEAIVTQEQYDLAQAAIHRRKKTSRTIHDKSDRVYVCAHCGRKLEKANGTVFACPSHRYHDGGPCENVRWKKVDLEKVIFETLKKQIQIIEIESLKMKEGTIAKEGDFKKEMALLKAQRDACNREKLQKYEDYREGQLTREEYSALKDKLTCQLTELEEQIEKCKTELRVINNKSLDEAKKQQKVGQMMEIPEEQLREHLYDFIDHVLVHDAEKIEIAWNFNKVKS